MKHEKPIADSASKKPEATAPRRSDAALASHALQSDQSGPSGRSSEPGRSGYGERSSATAPAARPPTARERLLQRILSAHEMDPAQRAPTERGRLNERFLQARTTAGSVHSPTVRGPRIDAGAEHEEGRKLDRGLRARAEAALGVDLDGVRIHDGEADGRCADALAARAYTVGRDIHFGPGEYRPGTPEGDRLIAHELVHVAQQGEARTSAPRAQARSTSDPHDVSEREADDLAPQIAGAPFAAAQLGARRPKARVGPDVLHRQVKQGASVTAAAAKGVTGAVAKGAAVTKGAAAATQPAASAPASAPPKLTNHVQQLIYKAQIEQMVLKGYQYGLNHQFSSMNQKAAALARLALKDNRGATISSVSGDTVVLDFSGTPVVDPARVVDPSTGKEYNPFFDPKYRGITFLGRGRVYLRGADIDANPDLFKSFFKQALAAPNITGGGYDAELSKIFDSFASQTLSAIGGFFYSDEGEAAPPFIRLIANFNPLTAVAKFVSVWFQKKDPYTGHAAQDIDYAFTAVDLIMAVVGLSGISEGGGEVAAVTPMNLFKDHPELVKEGVEIVKVLLETYTEQVEIDEHKGK